MAQKTTAHFEQDKRAFALLKGLVESKEIKLSWNRQMGESSSSKETKKRITHLDLCCSKQQDCVPDGDEHYRGSKPNVRKLAPKSDQYVGEQVALKAAGILLDYFKAL